jgi:type IV pilus assembly protein PilN
MIEINLLPGAGKKARGNAAGPGIGSKLASVAAQIRQPYMMACIASLAISGAVVYVMNLRQEAAGSELAATEQKQVQDSTRYAAVLREKKKAETQRDSVVHQLNIIKAIDNNRFVWPHIMDEISRAMPQYTWLTSLEQTSAVTIVGTIDTSTAKKSKKAKAETEDEPPPALRFRIAGNTVDIQALTRFMKLLEASPFVQNVQLEKSNLAIVDGKDVTEFSLSAEYQTPDSTAIRTIPLTLSVR